MWFWRRMEESSWNDRVINEEVCHRVREERNILYTINKSTANWICDISTRKCLLERVIEGKIDGKIKVTGRRGKEVSIYCITLGKGEGTGN